MNRMPPRTGGMNEIGCVTIAAATALIADRAEKRCDTQPIRLVKAPDPPWRRHRHTDDEHRLKQEGPGKRHRDAEGDRDRPRLRRDRQPHGERPDHGQRELASALRAAAKPLLNVLAKRPTDWIASRATHAQALRPAFRFARDEWPAPT